LVNPEDPVKNTLWTNDYTLELPIRMKKTGPASLTPITIVEMFE
jgi:long-chain-fatty-acid--CoA ligase ACSBG